jgi:signal transduction histidine kinase
MVRGGGGVLTKAKKTGGIPRAAMKRVSRDPGSSAAPNGGATGETSAPDMFGSADYGTQQPTVRPAQRPARRRALKNWRVRSRLVLLVVIPTVTAVAAGGIFIASSVQSALVYQRVLTLANLSGDITGLVQALQVEREDMVQFIVLGNGDGGRGAPMSSVTMPTQGYEIALLNQDYAVTNGWARQVEAVADGIGGSYSALAQQQTQAALTEIGNLLYIRNAATNSQIPAFNVIQEYGTAISTLLDVESQIAVGSSDSTLAGSVRVLGLVSSMKEDASEQQAYLTSALDPDLVTLNTTGFGPNLQSAVTDAQAQQLGDLTEFDTAATASQNQLFTSVVSGPNIVQAQAQEQQAISLASSKSPIATDPTISDASSALSYVVVGMRSVEQQFANSVISRSQSLRDNAITTAVIFGLAVVLLLGIALIATTVIGRSMVRPLRRLRNGALEVAEKRLPEVVRRMSETDGEGVPLETEPIDVDSSDEIGEVARAFDQVHREAVRLAADEAALRGNINAMFVNLSRRSQTLVERQIRVITRLEQSEQDSSRLASLFLMDHLATRMRRNSENLLVLAGHERSRRWSRPVTLVDVLRAAVSEIEQYERVSLNVQHEVSIRTEAVSDVVHLTAELLENATSFSATGSPVTISAYPLNSGGALIEITDQGVGITADEMARANWRLDNPPLVDVAVSRRMGLFVVARLAARHGIRIRLRPAPSKGLIAMVWLPDQAITRGTDAPEPLSSMPTASGNWDRVAAVPAPVREDLDMPAQTPHLPAEGLARRTAPGLREQPRPEPVMQEAEPSQYLRTDWGSADRGSADRGLADRGLADRGLADRGLADRGLADRGFADRGLADRGLADRGRDTPLGHVIVPNAETHADQGRLPIFEAVESYWFLNGRQSIGDFGKSNAGWSSPADDGWRAAATAVPTPASDGTTSAGLPKRQPQANLVPGTAASAATGNPPRPAPVRSAVETRGRYSGFQRGTRKGRAASDSGNPGNGEGTFG